MPRRVEMVLRQGLAAGMLWLAACGAGAQEPAADRLRPSGPVRINANSAEWIKGGAMVYSGNVRLESGDLKLSGDRLELRQFEDGQFEAKIDGAPAMLDHAGLALTGDANAERPPVSARAKRLTYDSRKDIVDVAGEALLTRGTDRIRGDNIRYDVVQRRIQAAGGDSGQVQIELEVPQRKTPGESLPAPKAPGDK